MTHEEKLDKIHQLVKECFGDAISVKIVVNEEGIEAEPKYKANSIKPETTINGTWLKSYQGS